MNAALIIGSYGILTITSLYLLFKNRFQYLLYSSVLLLTFGSVLGSLFKILHLPGADELLLIGFVGTVFGGIVLVVKAFSTNRRQIFFYKLIAGLLLLLQIALALFWPEHSGKAGLLNYPVTGLMATVLINEQYEHQGEKNLLILYLLQGFLYILIDVFKLF